PEVGQPDGFYDGHALVVKYARISLRGDRLPRCVLRQVPVHRPALVRHRVSDLAEHLGELLRVAERNARPTGARAGTAGTAAAAPAPARRAPAGARSARVGTARTA